MAGYESVQLEPGAPIIDGGFPRDDDIREETRALATALAEAETSEERVEVMVSFGASREEAEATEAMRGD